MPTAGPTLREECHSMFPSLPLFAQSSDSNGSTTGADATKEANCNLDRMTRSISFWTMTSFSSAPSMALESTASSSFDEGSIGSSRSVNSPAKNTSTWFQWLERGLADEARATATAAGSSRERKLSLPGTPMEGIEVFPSSKADFPLVLSPTSDGSTTSLAPDCDDLGGSIRSLGDYSEDPLPSTPPRVKSMLPLAAGGLREELFSSVEPGTPETDFGALDYASLHDLFIDALIDEQQSTALCWNDKSSADLGCHEPPSVVGRSGGSLQRTASDDSVGTASSEGTPSKRFRRRRRGPPGVLSRISARRLQESELNTRQCQVSGQGKVFAPEDANLTPVKKPRPRNVRVRGLKRAVSLVDRSLDDQSVCSLPNQSPQEEPNQQQSEWINVPLSTACTFLHPQCQLQKDKGKGESPGTAVCVWERNATMEKLAQKIDLLKTVSQNSTAIAELKRAQAVKVDPRKLNSRGAGVANDDTADVCETRSMLLMRLGLVSMKYGILLRWDQTRGLVRLVVLRKMCPLSFMDIDGGRKGKSPLKWSVVVLPPKSLVAGPKRSTSMPVRVPPSPTGSRHTLTPPDTPTSTDCETLSAGGESDLSDDEAAISQGKFSSFMWSRAFDAAIAVLQRGRLGESASGTEVTLLGPPYCISRPEVFPRPSLGVVVLRAGGLRGGKQRTGCVVSPFVTLTLGNQSHTTGVIKISSNPRWTRANRNHCRMICDESREMNEVLKVEILDWRPFRPKGRVLGLTYLPLKKLEVQPDEGEGPQKEKWTEMTLPCEMNLATQGSPFAFITISVVYRNHREWWIQRELEARKRQNIAVHDG